MIITKENYKKHSIGTKAANLFAMQAHGINVPDLFCTDIYSAKEAAAYAKEKYPDTSLFSVRSSALAEDGKEASCAGQFSTYLNVSCNELAEYIEKTARPVASQSFKEYCLQNGIADNELHITVIVQKMIEADMSGVIFTANPQGLLNETVVVVGKGTGDNVVEDKVDTTTGNLILDTGTGYATLMKSEQIPGQFHDVGDRIKVFISEVKSGETRGPLVTLSRAHPHFVKRLFELEIPEIQDGTIVIRSVARDAGSRTKIAVESRDENVDAIGSCIGKNGMRIGAILAELGEEKIDIIQYNEDPVTFVCEALSPAKVISAEMEGERTCHVTVAPDQLSLAIGREGQNAKLAAKLTGMKVDIKA